MSLKNTTTHYGTIHRLLHWIMSLIILTLLPMGLCMDDIADKALKMQVYGIHKVAGLIVLFLLILRMVWKYSNPKPASLNTIPWQKTLETAVHHGLYVLMLIMPISGWIMSTAAGHPVEFLGGEWVFPGIPVSKALAKTANSIHGTAAYLLIGLLILHIGGALKHHFINRDRVLTRMLKG